MNPKHPGNIKTMKIEMHGTINTYQATICHGKTSF